MACLAKWLSICLRTKWLWVRISLLLLKLQIWQLPRAGSFLTFKQTIECGSTLKLVRDMIRTYSQMHRADKYSEHSSIIWTIWLHGWVFVCELSGCEFEKLRLSQETSFLIKKAWIKLLISERNYLHYLLSYSNLIWCEWKNCRSFIKAWYLYL